MTTEKAIYQLTDLIKDRENFCHRDDFDDMFLQDIEALKVGIAALEKQVPKKLINPKKISNRRWADCCYCKLTLPKPCRFCPRCGQALDWSDENG